MATGAFRSMSQFVARKAASSQKNPRTTACRARRLRRGGPDGNAEASIWAVDRVVKQREQREAAAAAQTT